MKKKLFILFAAFLAFLFLLPGTATAGWVEGYWKSDGAYVAGYWRSDPNGLKYDNYSFDGDWSDAYNDSYYSSDRDYSADWYQPAWETQDDYWIGESYYDTKYDYETYDYNDYDYGYDFWDDPVYDYSPSYDYGYDAYDIYEPPTSYFDTPSFNVLGDDYDTYSPSYEYNAPSFDYDYDYYSYPSYSDYEYEYNSPLYDTYDSYDSYDPFDYNVPSYDSYDSYDYLYDTPSYEPYDYSLPSFDPYDYLY